MLRESPFRWTQKTNLAAKLCADDRQTDDQIALTVGVTRMTLHRWREHPDFTERVNSLIAAYAEAIKGKGIAELQNRVAAYNDRWDRMRAVIEARAIELATIPGGSTGLLVHTYKMAGGKEPIVMDEYSVDTGLLAEMRATEKQAAQELGQWTEKQEVTGKGGKPIAIATAAFDFAEYQRLYGNLTGLDPDGGNAPPADGALERLDTPAT